MGPELLSFNPLQHYDPPVSELQIFPKQNLFRMKNNVAIDS